MTRRHLILPDVGPLLVSTDLHGNLADLERLAAHFEALGPHAQWLVLGDLVHGPDLVTAKEKPELYGFTDRSPELIDRLWHLRREHPGRVHFVLGNHDAGHLGFRHTSKFHPDEVAALEKRLSPEQSRRLDALLTDALLAVAAPCGLLFTHGSPGEALTSLRELDGELPPKEPARRDAINELLWCYGQRGEVTARVLTRLSAEVGFPLHVVVHGHDRDESGWFVEGDNQVQPVIFGAPDANKRYLELDLAARYEAPASLRDGAEVRRLYS